MEIASREHETHYCYGYLLLRSGIKRIENPNKSRHNEIDFLYRDLFENANFAPVFITSNFCKANVCLAISYYFHAILKLFGTVFGPYA